MSIITVSAEDYQQLINDISIIRKRVDHLLDQNELPEELIKIKDNISEINKALSQFNKQPTLSEKWFDNQEVCLLLKISTRTLQSYRDNNVLPFSQIAGKIYYKAVDIEAHLEKHYVNIKSKK